MSEVASTVGVSTTKGAVMNETPKPKPASEHISLAYEWGDPKNDDYLEFLFDEAEARDSRD